MEISNLEIRTYDNPQIGGIDAGYANFLKIENVFINTGIYNPQSAQPTHSTAGLITPLINNGAMIVLDNITISGYNDGIKVNEHTSGQDINILACINGLNFQTAFHASNFVRYGAYANTNNVVVSGAHRFSIQQMNIEHDTLVAWQTTVYDLLDASDLGRGDITYATVKGFVGRTSTFTKSGGDSVTVNFIGNLQPTIPGNNAFTGLNSFPGTPTLAAVTIGHLEFQDATSGIGSNIMQNLHFDGTNWHRDSTGYTSQIQLGSGGVAIYGTASGAAGTVTPILLGYFNLAGALILNTSGTDKNGWLQIQASTTTKANIYLDPTGVAPTSKTNGMEWFDGTHLYVHASGTDHDLLATGSGTPIGGDGAAQYDSSGFFSGNNATYNWNRSTKTLSFPTIQTANASVVVGGLNIEPLGADNIIIGNNVYYNGAYKAVTTGPGEAINWGGGAMYFNTFPSTTAGSTPSATITNIYMDNTGQVKLGLNPSSAVYTMIATPTALTIANGVLPTGSTGDSALVGTSSGGVFTVKVIAHNFGQTTLVSGTKAITISGLTTSSRAFVQIVSQGGTVSTTVDYEAVCTSNTLTINAVTNAGTNVLNTLDGSTINYFVIN